MKIIKPGNPQTIERFTCAFCNCIFEADKNEYEIHSVCRIGSDYISVRCPWCGNSVVKSISSKIKLR